MEWITNNASVIVAAMGIIATIVSIITEMTKNIGFLKKIPTILQVIVLSVALWVVLYFGVCSAGYLVFQWYMLVASIIAGFITAYVSSYGWEKLADAFKRYRKDDVNNGSQN